MGTETGAEDGEGVGACGDEEGTGDEEDDTGERVVGAGVLDCTEGVTLGEDCPSAEGLKVTTGVEVVCSGVEVTLAVDPTQAK